MTKKQLARLKKRNEDLEEWAEENNIDLDKLDDGQQWIIFAGLQAVSAIGNVRPLKRLFSFFLLKSGMGLTSRVIGSIIGASERAVLTTKKQSPKEALDSVTQEKRAHRQPKLKPEHAGLIAKYLVENPKAQMPELIRFIEKEFKISVRRHVVIRFIEKYGLGCIRDLEITDRPPFLGTHSMEVLSSS